MSSKTVSDLHGFDRIDLTSLEKVRVDKGWYDDASSTRISNLKAIREIFQKIEDAKPAAFFGFYSNHIDAYTELWGKHSFSYKSEYFWKIWVLKLTDEENLLLLSAKGGGSSFEVSGPGCEKWPPVLSDAGLEKLSRIILTINEDLGKEIRARFEIGKP